MGQHFLAALQSNPRLLPFLGVTALVLGGLAYLLTRMRPQANEIARRTSLAQSQTGTAQDQTKKPVSTDDYQIKEPAQGLSLAELQQVAILMQRLNIPPQRAVTAFITMRIGMALVFAAAAFAGVHNMSWPFPLYVPTLAAGAGWFFLLLLVKTWVKKHNKTVGKGLADAIELIAICVDAGISLESALDRVSRELKATQPELAAELSLTWAQLSILSDRDQALINLAERINSQSLRSVLATLSQSMRFGTPLSQSLRTAAEDMRNEHLIRIEEKAARLPAMMTLPVMLLILPTIFLIVGGPAALKVMDLFSGAGH